MVVQFWEEKQTGVKTPDSAMGDVVKQGAIWLETMKNWRIKILDIYKYRNMRKKKGDMQRFRSWNMLEFEDF